MKSLIISWNNGFGWKRFFFFFFFFSLWFCWLNQIPNSTQHQQNCPPSHLLKAALGRWTFSEKKCNSVSILSIDSCANFLKKKKNKKEIKNAKVCCKVCEFRKIKKDKEETKGKDSSNKNARRLFINSKRNVLRKYRFGSAD